MDRRRGPTDPGCHSQPSSSLAAEVEELLADTGAPGGAQPPRPQTEQKREQRLARTLAEMADALDDAADIVALGPDQLRPRSLARRAAERIIEELAEQAKRLPDRFKADHPEVAWSDLVGMRGRIAHGYGSDIDQDVLWNALTVDLPRLREALGS